MIEYIALTFSWKIFTLVMYLGSMLVGWWCLGNDHDEDFSVDDDYWIYVIITLLSPLVCLVYLFKWCYGNGRNHKGNMVERQEQRLARTGEVGLTDNQIDRLGVNDR